MHQLITTSTMHKLTHVPLQRESDEQGQVIMAVRFKEPVKARKSLPLTERDLADIARLRGETPERQALSELTGAVVVESVAEAALLHMIF
jgi:hypothetical protein